MALPDNTYPTGIFIENENLWNEMKKSDTYVQREGETTDEREERVLPIVRKLWAERKEAWKKVWDTKASEYFPKQDIPPLVANEERQKKSEEWIRNKPHNYTRSRWIELMEVNGLESAEALTIVKAEESDESKIDLMSMAQGIDFGTDLDEIEKYDEMINVLRNEYNNWKPSEISIR